MAAFVPAMLAAFARTAPEPSPTAPGQASDPQRTAPPRHGRRRAAMVAQAVGHGRGGHRLGRCRVASSA